MPNPRNRTSPGSRSRSAARDAAKPAAISAPATRISSPSLMPTPLNSLAVRRGSAGVLGPLESLVELPARVRARQLDARRQLDMQVGRDVDPNRGAQQARLEHVAASGPVGRHEVE